MAHMLGDIANFEGSESDLALLKEIGEKMRIGCVCSLGTSAANPVLSSLDLFREDFENHIRQKHDKNCRTGIGS